MTDRREFLRRGAALIATLPFAGALRGEQEPRLPMRPIPGTDERLPVIGLGNSQAFRDGDLERVSDSTGADADGDGLAAARC